MFVVLFINFFSHRVESKGYFGRDHSWTSTYLHAEFLLNETNTSQSICFSMIICVFLILIF
jgi:hypothetical protein